MSLSQRLLDEFQENVSGETWESRVLRKPENYVEKNVIARRTEFLPHSSDRGSGPADYAISVIWSLVDGRAVITGVNVQSIMAPDPSQTRPITRTMLHDLGWGRIIARATDRVIHRSPLDPDRPSLAEAFGFKQMGTRLAFETAKEHTRARSRTTRGNRITEEMLREAADAYSVACAMSDPAPVKYAAEQLHKSYSTMKRWIRMARKKGFLPPTTERRALGNPLSAD